jgi:D-amino-acid dehydrogenase
MPYIGRIRAYDNLSTATGHAMMGISLAPITGKLMADVFMRELPAINLALLDPERYG